MKQSRVVKSFSLYRKGDQIKTSYNKLWKNPVRLKRKQREVTSLLIINFYRTMCIRRRVWQVFGLIKLTSSVVPPSPPVEIPSGSDFRHTVLAMRVIGYSPLCVLKSTTTNRVNANEEDEHDNVKNRYLLPISSHIFKNSSFARVAFIAQQIRVIIPTVTIRVL